MSSTSDATLRRGYCVIRALLDDKRGQTVSLGVAAWDSDAEWFSIRVVEQGERLKSLSPRVRLFATMAEEQIRLWAERKTVPYAGGLEPWTGEFWRAAARFMTSSIQLDEPRSMAPLSERELEMETLFEALVQPSLPARRKSRRIDGVITGALGSIARFSYKSARVPAFGGRAESVLRAAAGPVSTVVIEGVNLAARTARKDADALASRLMRITDHNKSRVSVIVGYVASPGGLNGETDMRDWLRERVTPHVFDLVSQKTAFRSAAVDEMVHAGIAGASVQLDLDNSKIE